MAATLRKQPIVSSRTDSAILAARSRKYIAISYTVGAVELGGWLTMDKHGETVANYARLSAR